MTNDVLRVRLRRMVLIATAVACGGGADAAGPGPVARLTVSIAADSMHIGESLRATVAAQDERGTNVDAGDVTWSSSAPDVATVTPQGIVRAVGLGLTSISASAAGRSSAVTVRVVPIRVSLVSLTPLKVVLAPGETRQLMAVPLDAAGRELSGRPVAWLSSDTTLVQVSETGLVTGVAPGITSVHAISEDSYASADVRVSGPPGAIAAVTMIPSEASLTIGDSLQLSTILEDAIGNVATDRPIIWQSSAPAVATVSPTGRVSALAGGSVVITATSEEKSGSTAITVHDPSDAISVSFADPDSNEVVGDTLSIYAAASSHNAIVRVHARVSNKETDLTEKRVGFLGLQQAWVGTLDMSLLRYGEYQLIATAYDDKGNSGVGVILFKRGARTGKGGTTLPPKNK